MTPIREWWPSTRDFFRDVWVEMKKVSWPGRQEVIGTTVVVIVACFIFGFYLFVIDAGLSWVVDKVFRAAGAVWMSSCCVSFSTVLVLGLSFRTRRRAC